MSAIAITSISGAPMKEINAEETYEVTKTSFNYAPIIRGDLEYYSSDLYFSQGYFAHPSTEYDPHLATASLSMAIASFVQDGLFDEDWYLNQSKYIKYFFERLEFNTFTVNEDYKSSARIDTIGVAVAKKEFKDYTLIGVVPRSGGYFREWASNVNLGNGSTSDMMHEGWYNAANKLINFVVNYVDDNNITGRIKLWMSGFSRGGATTNLAAGLIDNKLDKGENIFTTGAYTSRDDVYAYTFEAPQGANVYAKTVKAPKDSLYDNIFNIINPLDLVPKLAMKEYGFTRFGRDKYITNRFYDPDKYDDNRRTYKTIHEILNQNKEAVLHPDDFTMYGFSLGQIGRNILVIIKESIFGDSDIADKMKVFGDYTKKNYDANIASTILLEELTSHLGNRNDYVKKYESSLKKLMLIIQNEAQAAPGIFDTLVKIIYSGTILDRVFSKSSEIREIIAKKIGFEFADEVYKLISNLFGPLFDTYWERPNELLSIATNVSNVFENHYPDVTLAHLQSQDSYFIDAINAEKSEEEKINLVPLLDNADFGRMKFFGYNDIGLRLNSKNGKRVINIEGHILGYSEVLQCNGGYAAGYYSYATEEKMEAFMPINRKYNISMKSYSKKPYHRCEYWAYYQVFALNNDATIRKQLDHKKEKTCFNSDRHKRDVTIKL